MNNDSNVSSYINDNRDSSIVDVNNNVTIRVSSSITGVPNNTITHLVQKEKLVMM